MSCLLASLAKAGVAATLTLLLASPAQARRSCEELAAAPRAATAEPIVWAEALWRSVQATDRRLGALDARGAIAWIVEPTVGGWYCRDADTVYVSDALVDYAWQGRSVDGTSLMGFVLAHELAHRRFDTPADQASGLAPATGCDGGALALETRADRHAAFLLALTRDPTSMRGLSPFVLAQRDSLKSLLQGELGWSPECPALALRAAAIEGSTASMQQLGRLYDTAIALALLAPSDDLVPTLLAAIDDAVNVPGEPWAVVPEVRIARSLVHLSRAAEVGWCPDGLGRSPVDPDPCALRCQPIMPAHALLAPRDRFGARVAVMADAVTELTIARRLLAEAQRLGARPEQVAGITVCEAFASRDARRRDAAFMQLQRASAPDDIAMRTTLSALRATLDLQSFLLEEPAPIGTRAWDDALADLRHDHHWPATSDAARIVARWLGEALEPEHDLWTAASGPPELAPNVDAWVTTAPCGVSQTTLLRGGTSVATSASCAEIRHGGAERWRLIEIAPTSLSASRDDWLRYCTLEPRGFDDAGDAVVMAHCGAWDGPGSGWLLFMQGERWRRGVRFAASW